MATAPAEGYVRSAAKGATRTQLERLAAHAELLFIDDTWNLVACQKQYTTGVVARVAAHWITL